MSDTHRVQCSLCGERQDVSVPDNTARTPSIRESRDYPWPPVGPTTLGVTCRGCGARFAYVVPMIYGD